MPENAPTPDQSPQYLNPIRVLEQVPNGYLHLSAQAIDWLFCFHQGKLIYATHSIEPGDRLERHLRRLSHQFKTLTRETLQQIRLHLESCLSEDITQFSDYGAIRWMVRENLLSEEAAAKLVKQLIQEVLEVYLVLPGVTQKNLLITYINFPIFCELEISQLIQHCQQRLKIWQSLAPFIVSPCQRPYFFNNAYARQKLSEEQQQRLARILKGHSFYHLAAILNQDELSLAQRLCPLVKNKAIVVRDAQRPFNQLPKFYDQFIPQKIEIKEAEDSTKLTISDIANSTLPNKLWKIVCIDDSQTMLNEISRFLEGDNFQFHPIKESLKALMQIIRLKPDLILLDVSMPGVDGYQLCSLIRKNSDFKTTPIIMVTAKTGLIDRAKAKIAGASDYMTKPFTQEDLLKMIFRYLS